MLTLPDFKEKQIIFIKTSDISFNEIKFENENLVFKKDGQVVNRASCYKIFTCFIIGETTITTKLIRELCKFGISIFFLNNRFAQYASINSMASGNFLLRHQQYNFCSEQEFKIAKRIVENKIGNQIKLLEQTKNKTVVKKLSVILEKIKKQQKIDIEKLLGLEGTASKIFFQNYFINLEWTRRTPRTRQDITNFLMDIGYTILFNFIDSLLNLYGFDTYKGVYHKLFFQRKSLTCDLMEPFRCIIDRQILKSFNLRQINKKDFKIIKGKYELEYQNSQKYAEIFMETIMNNKEKIYCFIKDYYHFVMDHQKYKFPNFII